MLEASAVERSESCAYVTVTATVRSPRRRCAMVDPKIPTNQVFSAEAAVTAAAIEVRLIPIRLNRQRD